jgi:hypothetical protein
MYQPEEWGSMLVEKKVQKLKRAIQNDVCSRTL